jgi:hypothetical protein
VGTAKMADRRPGSRTPAHAPSHCNQIGSPVNNTLFRRGPGIGRGLRSVKPGWHALCISMAFTFGREQVAPLRALPKAGAVPGPPPIQPSPETRNQVPWPTRRARRSSASTSAPPTPCVAVMEGGEPKVIANAEGQPHHAVRRRLQRQGRAPRRRHRQAPGRHQPRAAPIYSIKRFMGRAAQRGAPARRRCVPYKVVGGPEDDVHGRRRGGKTCTPAGDLRAWSSASSRRSAERLPGREGQRGGHHRPRLLQRRPAPGHQGRRRRSPASR